MRDITELKRLQEQDIQRVTLEERQHLARDLHDSVGQVLGYVSFQVDAARKLLDNGNIVEADSQLARLSVVSRDAHADVREYILNLRVAPTAQEPLFKALQNYLDGFTRNYSIQSSMVVGAGLDENIFDAKAQLQLFRVAQEAVSNTRKHADARNVRVTFEKENNWVCMTIQDDGRGFDPGMVPVDNLHNFGLGFMRERAEQFGGHVHFQSSPGAGVRVLVEIPLKIGGGS